MYQLFFSRRFDRNLRKIVKQNPKLKSKVQKQIMILSSNPKHKSLRLHKLSGSDNWSISITKDIRVIFSIENDKIFFNRIGTHDEVY